MWLTAKWLQCHQVLTVWTQVKYAITNYVTVVARIQSWKEAQYRV